MPCRRTTIGVILSLELLFGLLACQAPPTGPAGTPVASPPRGSPGVSVTPLPIPTLTPTRAPALPTSPTVAPSASAPRGDVATAVVAGRPLPLRAEDFDLVEVSASQAREARSLREARVADLDGDDTTEVFAAIIVGPLADWPGGAETAYRIHYGLFSFDAARGRWASLRQEVVYWRPPGRYDPYQMWAEFADLTGAGRKQALLYSGYEGGGERARLEVLTVSGRKTATLLSLSGERFFAVRNGQVLTLLQPLFPPPLRTGDGPAVIVASEPVLAPSEAGTVAVGARLRYYEWDGRQFVQIRLEERVGYPALPTPLP